MDFYSRQQIQPLTSATNFVQKLYNILQNPAHHEIISWAPNGDYFVIKDVHEFSKSVLPSVYKHSNISSFVRQLNKYDFHKVHIHENSASNGGSIVRWAYSHPAFHPDYRGSFDNIKRKAPMRFAGECSTPAPSKALSMETECLKTEIRFLKHQLEIQEIKHRKALLGLHAEISGGRLADRYDFIGETPNVNNSDSRRMSNDLMEFAYNVADDKFCYSNVQCEKESATLHNWDDGFTYANCEWMDSTVMQASIFD